MEYQHTAIITKTGKFKIYDLADENGTPLTYKLKSTETALIQDCLTIQTALQTYIKPKWNFETEQWEESATQKQLAEKAEHEHQQAELAKKYQPIYKADYDELLAKVETLETYCNQLEIKLTNLEKQKGD